MAKPLPPALLVAGPLKKNFFCSFTKWTREISYSASNCAGRTKPVSHREDVVEVPSTCGAILEIIGVNIPEFINIVVGSCVSLFCVKHIWKYQMIIDNFWLLGLKKTAPTDTII